MNLVRPYLIISYGIKCTQYFQLNYQQKLEVSHQIVKPMVFMHSANPPVAHPDLKPENVLVSALPINIIIIMIRIPIAIIMQVEDHSFHVFLADFGLGQIMSTTRAIGTPWRREHWDSSHLSS